MLTSVETSTFALAMVGTGVVIAAVLIANPPARADSTFFRNWTRGLPADVAASVSEVTWKRLVRTYYACVIGVLVALGLTVHWVLPANRALPVITLSCLAMAWGRRFFVRRYLLLQALPQA